MKFWKFIYNNQAHTARPTWASPWYLKIKQKVQNKPVYEPTQATKAFPLHTQQNLKQVLPHLCITDKINIKKLTFNVWGMAAKRKQ